MHSDHLNPEPAKDAGPAGDAESSAQRAAAKSYEELVAEACAAAEAMQGWDFGFQRDRTSGEELSWSYPDLARELLRESTRALDLDTGGGELLVGLRPLPPYTVATEAWAPNVPNARQNLEPLGVEVRHADGALLPVEDGEFDLVLNRHGALDFSEIRRALAPGGVFLTQQVGSRNDLEFHEALGAPPPHDPDANTCQGTVEALRRQGFRVLEYREEFPEFRYHDIAAVVYQLLVVPWTVPGFDVHTYEDRLRRLHDRIRTGGSFVTHNHRYVVKAMAPASQG